MNFFSQYIFFLFEENFPLVSPYGTFIAEQKHPFSKTETKYKCTGKEKEKQEDN